MQNDFTVTSPQTLTLDALAITDINISFTDPHSVVIHIKDNLGRCSSVSIYDGNSTGLLYRGINGFEATRVVTPAGTTDVQLAMLSGALPGLCTYLLSSGLVAVDGGATVIQNAPTP